ncbi:hypothetical protein [Aquimarina sp. 2201CG14-23]|uniref:hypothetical protein n=1 Tax=Aquimarina mycalae TaxID=3040073 RepID=UPI002477D309|nr:hypothetical protein [Aquimarina sp. 2201CG14-23]MDH7447600.1 hypothetical protein [Aquimarina sp. 2201CG14-23]
MGGMLHPTAKGILDGRIKGLNNAVHITTYIIDNGKEELEIPNYYTLPGIEYYIGFGTGYEQGQALRMVLEKDSSSQITLDEKIECLSFLLKKQETCGLIVSTESFLDNIKYWGAFKFSKTNIDELQNLLKENKVQRAVDKMLIYLKENFYLKSLIEFYQIWDRLKNIRQEKKKNKEYIITEELEKIKIEVQNWIGSK